jgi:hypothetical protein
MVKDLAVDQSYAYHHAAGPVDTLPATTKA